MEMIYPWPIKAKEMVKESVGDPKSTLNAGRDVCIQEVIKTNAGKSLLRCCEKFCALCGMVSR